MVINAKYQQNAFSASASFARPNNTTAYAVGQVISTAVGAPLEFNILGNTQGEIIYLSECVLISNNPAAGLDFALALFSAQPSNIADHGVISSFTNGVGVLTPISSSFPGSIYQMERLNRVLPMDGGINKLWGILIAQNAYTPIANEQISVAIKGLRIR